MIVAIGLHAAGVVEGNALVISEGRAAGALIRVFGNAIGPYARESDLGRGWNAG
jgi:hypothetical protein